MKKDAVDLYIAKQLLDDAHKELARADEKASSALGAISTLIAVAAVVPSEFQFGHQILTWGWVWGLAICAVAAILLMLAVLPRFTTRSHSPRLAHFGDVTWVRNQQDVGHLPSRLSERSSHALLAELRTISKIVVIKYRFTRLGILCAAVGTAMLAMSVIR